MERKTRVVLHLLLLTLSVATYAIYAVAKSLYFVAATALLLALAWVIFFLSPDRKEWYDPGNMFMRFSAWSRKHPITLALLVTAHVAIILTIGFLFFFRIGLIQVLREVLPSLNLGVISLWIKENLEDLLIPFILSGVIGFVIIFLYYLDKWFLGPSFIFPSFLANSMLVCMFIIFFSVYLTAILSTIWKSTRLRLYLQEMEYNTLFPIQQIIPFPSGVISMQLFFAESEPPPPLGLGDAKFAALLGSFVGLGKAFLGFWLAVWVGALVGGLGLAVSVVKGVYRPGKVGIPFAPAMVIGILLVVSKGEWLIKLWEKVNQIILMKF